VFPGETTLNAAATLAAQDEVELFWVIAAGALGAIIGDSTLFLLARRGAARVRPQLDPRRRDLKAAGSFPKRRTTASPQSERADGRPLTLAADENRSSRERGHPRLL